MQATLFGLSPAAPSACSVLELGCGDGANLVPMAAALPGSEFVGVDLASAPVAAATAFADAVGAANVSVRRADLAELEPAALGTFDYVIAHGVYSWIPPAARDALLALCDAVLAPDGVAYVSYNAYPGSYLRDAARDILRFHVAGEADPRRRMDRATALMSMIARAGQSSPHARALAEHLSTMLARPREILFHDELADISTPVYFHEFVEHATAHGLQFLAEARLAASRVADLPAEVAAELDALGGDVIMREQYVDFLTNRLFRETLLCRADRTVRDVLRPVDVAGMWASAPAHTDAPADALATAEPVCFTLFDDEQIETADPQLKGVLARLGRAWPAAIRVADLARDDRTRLAEGLLRAHAERLVELHVEPPAARRAGERPVAPAVARHQAATGSATVTTLRHMTVRLDDVQGRRMLTLLDGSRGRAELAAELGGAVDEALDRLAALSLIAA